MAIVITDEDARRHITMAECIEAMRVCFGDFAEGKAASPPRLRYTVPTGEPDRTYYANIHAGAVPSSGVACVRAGTHIIDESAYRRGRRTKRNPEPVNWTVIILYDIKTSEPLAFLHESYLSGMRVGATSGAAVDAIARDDAQVLGLLGTGRQSRAHFEAIAAVRPIKRVKVFSPNQDHLNAFVAAMARPDVKIVPVSEERAVVDGADIVCCATNTTEPVVKGEWLTEGQMVISIANSDVSATRREVDEEVFARAADIVINDWDSVHASKQVELLEPIESGRVARESVHLLGDIFAGRATVKSRPDSIVYYKNNTGLAMQFAAAGAILHRNMVAAGGTDRVIPREWLAAEQYGIG